MFRQIFVFFCLLGDVMEFLELSFAFVALLLIWLRPKSENFAFVLMWLGWLLMIYLYVGHTSAALFGNLNL